MSQAVSAFFAAVKTVATTAVAAATNPQTWIAAGKFALRVGVTIAANNLAQPSASPEQTRIPFRDSIPVRQTGTGRARISGPYMLFEAVGENAYTINALHDPKVDAFEQWWLNDDPVTVGVDGIVDEIGTKYRNDCVELQWRFGEATETNYLDASTALGSTIWPTTARGDGVASLFMRANAPAPENFTKRFPNGLPAGSVTGRLSLVYDPRDSEQDRNDPETWAWSDNPVLGLLHRLCFAEGGDLMDYDRRIAPTVEYWKRAADVCDELVPLKAGGTEKRYRHGLVWRWNEPSASVIQRYVNTFDGWLSPRGDGALVVYAGRFYPPAVTLTEAHILGHSLKLGQEVENDLAVAIVSYCSPDHKFNVVETTPWPDQDTLATVGEDRAGAVALPDVQSNGQARRLAKRAFLKGAQTVRGQLFVDLLPDDGTEIEGERYLRVRLPAPEPAVLRDLVIEVEQIEHDTEAGVSIVTFVRCAGAEIDDWDAATEEGDGPGGVTSVEGEDLTAPDITSAEPEEFLIGETSVYRLLVVTPDNGVSVDTWLLQWRVVGDISWTVVGASPTDIGASIELRTGALAPNALIEVQIAYITTLGGVSDYGPATPAQVDFTGL